MAAAKINIFGQVWKATYNVTQENLLLNALGKKYNYQVNILNPTYDPTHPITPQNPVTIPNPQTKQDYIAQKILEEILGAAKVKTLEEVQLVAVSTAQTQVNTSYSGIPIIKDTA